MVIAQPLRSSQYARARWLVLAPHADDETLGVGALVAETAAAGRLAGIVYLTDGMASHGHGGSWLARLRRREAGLAARRLGSVVPPVFLDWPDAHPYGSGSPEWRLTVRALAALIRSRRVDVIAVTGAHEQHCDHAAFHALAVQATRAACRSVALFEYRVWSDPTLPDARRTLRTRAMPTGKRRSALMAHRSQTSNICGPGFRLTRSAWRMAASDVLHLNCPSHAR